MEFFGKGLLHFYQETPSLTGNQANHRTNMLLPYESNSYCEQWQNRQCSFRYFEQRSINPDQTALG